MILASKVTFQKQGSDNCKDTRFDVRDWRAALPDRNALWEPHKDCAELNQKLCGGQVISDSLIGFIDVDLRSKALGDELPSFECSLTLL